MDPEAAAKQLVDARFPDAIAAFVCGSVLTPARTATSDLDIVVIRPIGSPAYRETIHYAGWPVELFVTTPAVYAWFLEREIADHKPSLLNMVALGVALVDVDAMATRLQAAARHRHAAGPPPVKVEQVEDQRYGLSDLLDDLDGATDPDEIVFIATTLFTATAKLALTVAGVWLGGGKWLGRCLLAVDPALHGRLLPAFRAATTGDKAPLRAVAYEVLDRAGGRLMEGYHRKAPELAPP